MPLNITVLKQYFTNLFYLRRIHSALGAIHVGTPVGTTVGALGFIFQPAIDRPVKYTSFREA